MNNSPHGGSQNIPPIVPDEQMETLGRLLKSRLTLLVREVCSTRLGGFISGPILDLVSRMGRDNSAEVLLWRKPDSGPFRVAWTSQAPESEVLDIVIASREAGLPSRVFSSLRDEAGAARDLRVAEWSNLELRRGRQVVIMAAAPVIAFDQCVGVLSLVRYAPGGKPDAVPPDSSFPVVLSEGSVLLGKMIEHRLIFALTGL